MTTQHLTRIKAQSMAHIKRVRAEKVANAGKAPKPTERQIQRSIIQWCRTQRVLCFHIPNAGKRTRNHNIALLKDGMLAGVPDLAILLPNRKLLWVEVKNHRGTLEDSQKAVHAMMGNLGHEVHVVRSLVEVQALMMGVIA